MFLMISWGGTRREGCEIIKFSSSVDSTSDARGWWRNYPTYHAESTLASGMQANMTTNHPREAACTPRGGLAACSSGAARRISAEHSPTASLTQPARERDSPGLPVASGTEWETASVQPARSTDLVYETLSCPKVRVCLPKQAPDLLCNASLLHQRARFSPNPGTRILSQDLGRNLGRGSNANYRPDDLTVLSIGLYSWQLLGSRFCQEPGTRSSFA